MSPLAPEPRPDALRVALARVRASMNPHLADEMPWRFGAGELAALRLLQERAVGYAREGRWLSPADRARLRFTRWMVATGRLGRDDMAAGDAAMMMPAD